MGQRRGAHATRTIGLPAKGTLIRTCTIEFRSANDGKVKPRNKKQGHCYAEKWIPSITYQLSQEGVSVLKVSLFALLKKFNSTGLVIDLKRKPRSIILGHDHSRFIDEAMTVNNELTSRQFFSLFTARYPDIQVSVSIVKHLGWVSKKTRYCALIREASKEKRLLWCQQRVEQNDLELNDVIFSDESSVQLESHRKTCYHKTGQPSRLCDLLDMQ